MPTVQGNFNTGNFTQNLAALSFDQAITRLMPNGKAPLFGISSMLGTETAVQVEHGFFTKTAVFPSVLLTAAVADGVATTLTVASTANMIPGMILQVDTTHENMIVNTVPSATSITVTRGTGNVAPVAIADATNLWQVGNAFEEASVRPQAMSINPVRVTNLTQIFRDSWGISGSAASTSVIAGDSPPAENRQDCGAFHANAMERAILFGQKSQSTRNGQPFRTMDGLISIVGNITYYPPSYSVPNVFTAAATTNYTQLEAMLDPCFDQTTDPKVANERTLFVGGAAHKVLNNIGRLNGTYMMVDGQTDWGLQFSTFKTTRGTFRVIEHPQLNTNASWAKMAIAVDVSTFKLAYLQGRKTSSKEYNASGNTAQDNGIDAEGGTLTTEMTALVKNPPANSIIYGLTAAAEG